MGLLDWLTEGTGSSIGGSSMPMPPTMLSGTPPMQQTGTDAYPTGGDPMMPPPPPMPQGADPMSAGGDTPNGPGLPYSPGGDPMTAGGAPSNGPGLPPPPAPIAPPSPPNAGPAAAPPSAAPASGAGMPPAPPLSLMPPNPGPMAGPNATGFLGRALGLDRNRENTVRGALGAGLKAAGENAHKPGLAAFAGSMGSGIEGGKGADDKTTEQESKYLTQAIAAAKAGDERSLNVARTHLALAQAKAAQEGDGKAELNAARTGLVKAQTDQLTTGGGKSSVANSDQQLMLRANQQALAESQVSANGVKQALTAAGGNLNDPTYKKALEAHNAQLEKLKAEKYAQLGIDPKKAAKLEKQPGMTRDNPYKAFPTDPAAAKKAFDELPVGAYFVNPSDNRLLIKQPAAGANPPPAASSAPPASSTPPTPPAPVTVPAGSAAENDE